MFWQVITAVIILALGFFIGEFSLKNKSKYFDFSLCILIILFLWIGKDSYLIKIFDFQIRLTFTVQLLLIGILIKRLLSFYFVSKRNKG